MLERKVLGKMVTKKDQFYGKLGYGSIHELQLMKWDTNVSEIIEFIEFSKAEGVTYPTVHSHLLGGESNSPAVLESYIVNPQNYHFLRITFEVANYSAKHTGSPVGVVLHCNIPSKYNPDLIGYINRLMEEFPNTYVLLESSSFTASVSGSYTIDCQDKQLEYMMYVCDQLSRAKLLIDITHHAMNYKVTKQLQEYGFKDLKSMTTREILEKCKGRVGAVHLAHCFHTGVGMGKHGTTFNKISGGEYLLNLLLKLLDEVPLIIIEVEELDYTNPINYKEIYNVICAKECKEEKRMSDRLTADEDVLYIGEKIHLFDFTSPKKGEFIIRVDKPVIGEIIQQRGDSYIIKTTDMFWAQAIANIYGLEAAPNLDCGIRGS